MSFKHSFIAGDHVEYLAGLNYFERAVVIRVHSHDVLLRDSKYGHEIRVSKSNIVPIKQRAQAETVLAGDELVLGEENMHGKFNIKHAEEPSHTTNTHAPCPFPDCSRCSGKPHRCHICQAVNLHRSIHCPSKEKKRHQHRDAKAQPGDKDLSKCKKKAATVTIIAMDTRSVLVCRRGVDGKNHGKIFSQGGGVDRGESFEQAACREAWEEAGVRLHPDQLLHLNSEIGGNTAFKHFYVFVDHQADCVVNGPPLGQEWELEEVPHILGVPTMHNTRLAWVPVAAVVADKETSHFKRLLHEIHQRMSLLEGSAQPVGRSIDQSEGKCQPVEPIEVAECDSGMASRLEEKSKTSWCREFSFFAIGDFGEANHKSCSVARSMASLAERNYPRFVISLGDNMYDDGVKSVEDPLFQSQWADVFIEPFESLRVPWMIALGNHDYYGNTQAQIDYTDHARNPVDIDGYGLWRCPGRNYSFAVNSKGRFIKESEPPLVEFFCLDTNGSQDDVAISYPGIRDDLSSYIDQLRLKLRGSAAKWKIVYGHHPLFTLGRGHGVEARYLKNKCKLHDLLVENRADLYLSGHEHVFQSHCDRGVHHLVGGASSRGGFYGGRDKNSSIDWHDESKRYGFLSFSVSEQRILCQFVDAANNCIIKEIKIEK